MARTRQEAVEAETATETATATEGTQTITVQSISFAVPAPYSEGHTVNAVEAAALNQTFGENLRNNFASKVRSAKEAQLIDGYKADGKTDEEIKTLLDAVEFKSVTLTAEREAALRAEFATYAAEYSFQGKRAPRAPADPVGKEAHKIAKEMVTAALRQRSVDLKTLPDGKMDELINGLLAKTPQIREEAERRVNAVKDVASDVLGDLGI